MIELINNYWAVKVPVNLLLPEYTTEQSISRLMNNEEGDDELVIRFTGKMCGSLRSKIVIQLPPGNWQIVCTSKGITEEQAAGVVERSKFGYLIYLENYTCIATFYQTPKPSFHSLLTSKGCDVNKTYLILKKL